MNLYISISQTENRFTEALIYIIHCLWPHQAQKEHQYSQLLACSIHFCKGLHAYKPYSAHTDSLSACVCLFSADHLPLEAENNEVICKEKAIKNHLQILDHSQWLTNRFCKQEVSHTFLITQMQKFLG